VPVAEGLDQPLFLGAPDDRSGRRFVAEQPGRIVVIDAAGKVSAKPHLDIRDRVSQDGGARGLLGLAFDPSFVDDGRLFLDYTDRQGDTVASEFHATVPGSGGGERTIVNAGDGDRSLKAQRAGRRRRIPLFDGRAPRYPPGTEASPRGGDPRQSAARCRRERISWLLDGVGPLSFPSSASCSWPCRCGRSAVRP
jgi:hypothetical protein